MAIQKISFRNETASHFFKNLQFVLWQSDFSNLTALDDSLQINPDGTLYMDSKDDMRFIFTRDVTRTILLYSNYTQNEMSLITDNLECVFLQEGFSYRDISMLCEA